MSRIPGTSIQHHLARQLRRVAERRIGSAVVGSSAGQHASDEDDTLLGVAGESHAPVTDAHSQFIGASELSQLAAPWFDGESRKRGENAPADRRVESCDVLLGASGVLDPPRALGVGGAERHAYLWSISSWETVRPASMSARPPAAAASSSAVISSSSSGASRNAAATGSSRCETMNSTTGSISESDSSSNSLCAFSRVVMEWILLTVSAATRRATVVDGATGRA